MKIFIFCFIISAIASAQTNSWYQKLTNSFNYSNGVSLLIDINQKQFDTDFKYIAKVEFFDKNHYIVETPAQSIYISNDTIKTFIKSSEQLIIDNVIEREITFIDILAGDSKDIVFDNLSINDNVSMDFNIASMGYYGNIKMSKNGHPIELKIYFGPNQYILLSIVEYKTQGLTLYNNFNPMPNETIYLNE